MVNQIIRVYRTKEQAKKTYDKISMAYDFLAGSFEGKLRVKALDQLNIKNGETILEIGFGTGHCLIEIAKKVGDKGKTYGVDISSGMCNITRKKLKKEGLLDKVELYCGDAMILPYEDNMFDAVFTSFTLELFDTPEIPIVLKEIKRLLKSNGRICVVSLAKENKDSRVIRVYEWIHKNFPSIADCRPIFVEQSLKDAKYQLMHVEKIKLLGIPIEIVIGVNKN